MTAPYSNTTLAQAALDYVERGFPVFPLHDITAGRCSCGKVNCPSPGKHPRTAKGFEDATTDIDLVREWWARWPNANIGMPTGAISGVDVLDVEGDEGRRSLESLVRAHGALPETACVRTGGKGGTHIYFARLPDVDIANSSGRVGTRLDVRGTGGYVVLPPSVGTRGTYEWVRHPETVPPAPPPEWLLQLMIKPKPTDTSAAPKPVAESNGALRRAQQYAAKARNVSEGQRNSAAMQLAGHLAAFPVSESDALALLRPWNSGNSPPLDDGELALAIHSGYVNGTARAPKEERVHLNGHANRAPPESYQAQQNLIRPAFKPARELLRDHPDLRPPVIHCLLRRGETMNVIAPSKTGKSWLALDLALSIVSGQPWLGRFRVERGEVLILDNELHAETSAHRLPKVAEARDLRPDDWCDRLHIDNLRGRLADIYSLRSYFAAIKADRFSVVVVDAFYRVIPRDTNENDNGEVANMYNALDAYASQVGCSFVLIHHSSKGLQSDKAVTDVGAGAGAQSRAADTHLILRAHEEQDVVVIEGAVRSWPPIEALCLRWNFPVWNLAYELDPTALRKASRRRKDEASPQQPAAPKAEPWTVERFVESFITRDPVDKKAIRATSVGKGLSGRQTDDLLVRAEADGLAHRWKGKGNVVRLANIPEYEVNLDTHTRAPPIPPNGACARVGASPNAREQGSEESEGSPLCMSQPRPIGRER